MSIEKRPEVAGVFGAWVVEVDGTIHGTYETSTGKKRTVHLYPERLAEPGILLSLYADRMAPAEWAQFMPAFFLACRLAGITQVAIQTDFE